jgi:hypothetical protein
LLRFGRLQKVGENSPLEGWLEVPGWFGMFFFQRMLPEVCNFGFSLFFFPLMKKEAKKSRLQIKKHFALHQG